MIKELLSLDELKLSIQEKGLLHVICFRAQWSEASTNLSSLLAELSEEHENVVFATVEAEDQTDLAFHFNIHSVPTTIFCKSSLDILHSVDGADVEEIMSSLAKFTDMNSYLKDLICKSKIMIFIKGTPEAPRCGFTRTLLGILTEANVSFDYFDILGDFSVREALKKYSHWPTYPQVYLDGELVGGLDIIKDMQSEDPNLEIFKK